MGIDFDEIEAELHQEMDKQRKRDAKLEVLRQKRDALIEEADALDEEMEHIRDPSGENKDRLAISGPEEEFGVTLETLRTTKW